MARILITGGIKRIGGFLSSYFLQKGHNLILHSHHLDLTQQETFLKNHPDDHPRISFIHGDLSNPESIMPLAEDIIHNFGVPDHFIHTASLFEKDDFNHFSWEYWQKHRAIHVDCPVLWMHYFYTHRLPQQKISGIMFIDQRTHAPTPEFFSYSASKMMLASLVPLLSVAATPDMRVNAISPGPVLKNYRQSEDDFQQQVHSTPLQKQISQQSLANICDLFIQNESITGQILTIDSGQHLDWRTEAFLQNKE